MADNSKDDDDKDKPEGEGAQEPFDLSEELIRKWSPERLSKTLTNKHGKQRKLDTVEQSRYEKRFGVDLSRVRIVTGSFAEEFTAKHSAEAITVGSTGMVLMRQSQSYLGGAAQESVLAHELTHVAQAMPGMHRKNVEASAPDSDHGEAEAGAHEAAVHAEESGGHHGEDAAGGDGNPVKKAEEEKERREKILAIVLDLMDEDDRVMGLRNGERTIF